jgi:SSS family solute:Na+ symporter
MMLNSIHGISLLVFILCIIGVVGGGLLVAQRKSTKIQSLSEWGLGGRKFGVFVTWFLIGGDFYTAYTVIAIPALVYSVGAYGFFALPYTIIVYPFVFLVMPRLWAVCTREDYITAADFVQGRYGSVLLSLAVAVTSLMAVIPYIALQLIGMQVVMASLVPNHGSLPLWIAFLILALYTYHSGIKAPAMLAFGKDIMIYIVVITAVVWIPYKLGGFRTIFSAANAAFAVQGGDTGLELRPAQMIPYATMALGSALAAFMYPHTLAGILSSSGSRAIKLNAVLLPVYTILLGLIALLGYMAIAAKIHVEDSNAVVPVLFAKMFPDWFLGFSFAAIVIAALVPAAIMAIGGASLFTRNIWKPFVHPEMTSFAESKLARRASVAVLFAALCFVMFFPTQYAIDLQLIGGIWILQIFPTVVFGLYRTDLLGPACLLGWLSGMTLGTWWIIGNGLKPVASVHFLEGDYRFYIGVIALAANIVVSFSGSYGLKSVRALLN